MSPKIANESAELALPIRRIYVVSSAVFFGLFVDSL